MDKDNRTGFYPNAVLFGSNGYIYGTTTGGGKYGHGVLFRIDPATGASHVLFDFGSTTDPLKPIGQLVEGSGHILYGYESDQGRSYVYQFNITP